MKVGAVLAALLAWSVFLYINKDKVVPYFNKLFDSPPLSEEEAAAKLLKDHQLAEVEIRKELAAEPDSPRLQARLALSLLETNGSRIILSPERLDEGRELVQAAVKVASSWWRIKIAQTALLLADSKDVDAEQASQIAEAALQIKMNQYTNRAMGLAYLVDGCALLCRCRAAHHRTKLDPPGAVYEAGKEPEKIIQSHMQTAMKRLTEAGKRLHASIDTMLYERYGNSTTEAQLIEHLLPYMGLLYLEKHQGGVHIETLFRVAGCEKVWPQTRTTACHTQRSSDLIEGREASSVASPPCGSHRSHNPKKPVHRLPNAQFEGRKLNGKVCPTQEPQAAAPKKKKSKKKATS